MEFLNEMKCTQWVLLGLSLFLFSCSNSKSAEKILEINSSVVSDPDEFIGKYKAKTMVLGVFHFANPGGHDYEEVFEVNILLPERQLELEILLNKLAIYNPTKILIERSRKTQDSLANLEYTNFLNGKFSIKEKNDEQYQIAFKLAKKLGHSRIYCSDARADEWFGIDLNWEKFDESKYLKSKNQYHKSNRYDYETFYRLEDSLKASLKLTDYLKVLNNPKNRLKDHQQYLTSTSLMGAGDNYIGADALARWYRRNLRIYSNVYDIVNFNEQERVLIIYGSGHVWSLRQFFKDSPDFDYVEPNDYL